MTTYIILALAGFYLALLAVRASTPAIQYRPSRKKSRRSNG